MVLAEQNYSITEQELFAVMEALKAFCCYIDGIPFNLITDHKPNTFLPTLPGRQTCWSEYLRRFNFTWIYRPGRTNVADPLSRYPSFQPVASAAIDAHVLHAMLNVTTRSKSAPQPTQPTQLTPAASAPINIAPPQPTSPIPDSVEPAGDTVVPSQTILAPREELIKGYANDAWCANDADLQQYEEVWWKGDRIMVPNIRHVRSALLWDYHDSPFAGHLGVNKTLNNLQRSL